MRALDAQRINRLPSAALLLLAGALALSAVVPPAASANQYEVVEVCKRAHDDLIVEDTQIFPDEPLPSQGFRILDRCQPSGDGSLSLIADGPALVGGKQWVLRAPADTTIRAVEFDRVADGTWGANFAWEVKDASSTVLESFRGVRPTDETVVHDAPELNTSAVIGSLYCQSRGVCPGRIGLSASVQVSNMTVILEDNFSPQFVGPLGGSLASDGALRDIEQVAYLAEDRGAGIAGAFLVVDGFPLRATRDFNGGNCEEPYRVMLPCRTLVNTSLPLDTTFLSEGVHRVEVVLVDGAGNREKSVPVSVLVHNAPSNVGRPAIQGTPRVGGRLSVTSGNWLGDPFNYSYQWLRCPGQTQRPADCRPIPGATTAAYIPSKADRGSREMVVVTAANFAGSEAAASDVTQPVGAPAAGGVGRPALRGVRLSRTRFSLDAAPTLGFSSSVAGRLSAVVVGSSGKALAFLKRKVRAGRGAVSLGGMFRQKAIRPGSYQLLVFLTDAAGNFSRPARLAFKVTGG